MKVLLLFSFFTFSLGSQHLVCKTIDDIFSSTHDTGSGLSSRRLQGPAGKRGFPGARGEAGLPGPPGPPATVDYEKVMMMINETISRDLEKVTARVEKSLSEIRANVQELVANHTDQLHPEIVQACRAQDGLLHNRVCYIAITEDTNYAGASEKCARIGGLLAEIHTRSHQNTLMDYIRPKLSSSYKYFWIGSTYHHPNLRYRSGKEVSNTEFQWRSGFGYPNTNEQYNKMALIIYKSKSTGEGFRNFESDNTGFMSLCEKTN